jgi:hypothetical protein
LVSWAKLLASDGRIVVTTPHPSFIWLHETGAAIGICSREAADEHHRFFDRVSMERVGKAAGLRPLTSERFLCGVNQLFVLVNADSNEGHT